MTLYLRLHAPRREMSRRICRWIFPKDAWRALMERPQPWQIRLAPARLLLLEG